jgi:integral membrane protein
MTIFATPHKLYKTFAFAEAVTWTLLLSGLAIRATVGAPPHLLLVVGGLHGFVFLAYGATSILVGINQRWSIARTLAAVALAIVPYATIPFERSVEKRDLLKGAWRTTATDDKRDANWFDRLFRWFLSRPALLGVALFAAIAGIFAALLIVGPPGGWQSEK